VVNLFKQKVYHKKRYFCYRDTSQQFFVTDFLTIVTAQIVHHIYPFIYMERYVYALTQIKTYTVSKKSSQRNNTQKQLEPHFRCLTEVLQWEF